MKTQYYAASSLDGYIATAQNSLDWLLQFGAVEGTSYPAFIREVGAIAMGSTTYDWILRHPTPPLRLISATTYGEAFAELRYEVPRSPGLSRG